MMSEENSSLMKLKAILREKFAMNRAVAYLLITRGWQFVSAPITIFLIFRFFGERLQGYYYIFISLLASQMFFELGLNTILSLLTSHEWAQLGFDENGRLQGESRSQSRLASLVRYGDRWYRSIAGLFIVGLILVGSAVIQDNEDPSRFWFLPWLAAVVVNGVSLIYQPRLAVLEGCGQIANVNFVRMFQAVTGTAVVWTVIVCGGGLWTVAASNAIRLLWEVFLVHRKYRPLFASIREITTSEVFSWREEIWPLQWRLAIQSVGGYFSSYFFVPVLDQYHGKVAAGRMGMSWSILSTLQSASQSWTQSRVPEFAVLAAQNRISELESKMKRIGSISIGLFTVAGLGFSAVVWCVEQVKPEIAQRFLDPELLCIMTLSTIVLQVSLLQHTYVRLFKRDPFLLQNSISAIATGGAAWYFGHHFGAAGIVYSYMLICCFYTLPISTWVMLQHRRIYGDENRSNL